MPATYTPPQLEPHHSDDAGDRDSGGSGRLPPPPAKHTGGGGEDDDWDQRPVGSRGPRERLAVFRIGLGFALFGIVLIFVALVATFIVTKHSGHIDAYDRWINSWLPTRIPSILWLNTAALALSSFTAELARRSMFRESAVMEEWIGLGRPTSNRAGAWLLVTTVLGALFIGGQLLAWQQLAAAHAPYIGNPSMHLFYVLTGAHAAHLLLGFCGLLYALWALRSTRALHRKQVAVDIAVWYWHAMGLIWLALFALLELGQ